MTLTFMVNGGKNTTINDYFGGVDMKSNITNIEIFKNIKDGRYPEMCVGARGQHYNNSCSIDELNNGSIFGQSFIKDTGLTRAEIDWINRRAYELMYDARDNYIGINLKTKKMEKYFVG